MEKDKFSIYQEHNRVEHPEWSQDQVDSMSALNMQTDELIDEGHTDFTDEFLRLVIRRAQQWIGEHLPYLLERVKDGFEYLYNHIGDWIQKGIEYLKEHLIEYITNFI